MVGKKIDYRKVARIAAAFEAELGLTAEEEDLAQEIDERTKKEQEQCDCPKPCLPASVKEDKVKMVADDEKEEVMKDIESAEEEINRAAAPAEETPAEQPDTVAGRKASVERLLKMARAVKASRKLTAKQRAAALERIRRVAKSVVGHK